jgi:hypothetical protein
MQHQQQQEQYSTNKRGEEKWNFSIKMEIALLHVLGLLRKENC